MYEHSADIYDVIAASIRDIGAVAARLHAIIQRAKRAPGTRLLDAACGTGPEIGPLRQHYTVEGLDLFQSKSGKSWHAWSPPMVAMIARTSASANIAWISATRCSVVSETQSRLCQACAATRMW